ncbi:KAP family P-loop NTPase fold protein [Methylovulum miyakonense]|uniref:KAP family P-loop NTPase fold protein n=1 Tax=Methylovulum miyakonense TaxID=645578 RepID=UPI0003802398|nr:P-loop NTPase fold protein [Methylovulum miyakonense]
MNQQTNPQYPLAVSNSIEVEEAFKGDLLGRKNLAIRLTSYLDRLKAGAVLAIDAKWGDGKTWFGKNWAKQLQEADHRVIFIDAFEQDYVDDPFVLIAAEIAQALDNAQEDAHDFREKTAGVMKAILPVGTKVLLNAIGRIALGSADISGDFKDAVESANDSAADMAEKWIEDKLKNYAEEKESLKHFKDALKQMAEAQPKPIVIIIDELDRCRPSFAVKLIERIKHFFDVPNVVFVLLINRKQLEEAIKGVYGQGTEASEYLGKFVNFFFKLPKTHLRSDLTEKYITNFVTEVLNRYRFESSEEKRDFIYNFCTLAAHFNLSLRDIERCIALYAFTHPIDSDENKYVLPYIITLKIAKQDLFLRLLKGDISNLT